MSAKKKAPETTEDLDALAAETTKETPTKAEAETTAESTETTETPFDPDAKGESKSEDSTPLPQHLQEQAAALRELTERLEKEITDFKAGQSYVDGDVPVYLQALGGKGIGPTDNRIGYVQREHLDSRYAYRWCNKQMVDYHRGMKGRWTVQKKDFDVMTKARGGHYSFQTNAEGHVVCGDLVLMATTQEQNEALKQRVREKTRRGEGRARGHLQQLGHKLGVEVTGDDDVGPKVQRIMETISKELGPDALKVFQGRTR